MVLSTPPPLLPPNKHTHPSPKPLPPFPVIPTLTHIHTNIRAPRALCPCATVLLIPFRTTRHPFHSPPHSHPPNDNNDNRPGRSTGTGEPGIDPVYVLSCHAISMPLDRLPLPLSVRACTYPKPNRKALRISTYISSIRSTPLTSRGQVGIHIYYGLR